MRALFVSTDKLLSKTIKSLTGENVSHVAIEFPECGIVVHSDLLGLHIQTSRNFRKAHQIVYELETIQVVNFLDERIQKLMESYEFHMYDYGAFFFLGFSLLARDYLKIPLPKSNLWQESGMFLCVGWLSEVAFDKEDDMITPYKLYQKMLTSNDWKIC